MMPIRCANSSCAARSFIQLAKRRFTTAPAPATTAHLDFLVPQAARAPLRISSGATRLPATSNGRHGAAVVPTSRRLFSTTAPRKATTCVQNPVQDEEGNDMILEITPRAAKRLSEIMKKDANPNLALRIQVESGGCHGFQYLMSLVTIPGKDAQEFSSVVAEDDSIFEYAAEEGGNSGHSGARIILDEPSLDLLKGSKVDFTMELIGSQFKIVDNPYASSSCGCGTSFDIKM